MSEKISSASDTDFREEIGKAIPQAHTAAMLAGAVTGYLLGKKTKRVKRRKSN